METTNGGSRGYLVSIVMVAVLGGLLFGYDTAVISGADKGLQAFFMGCLLYTSPSPRDVEESRMPSSA